MLKNIHNFLPGVVPVRMKCQVDFFMKEDKVQRARIPLKHTGKFSPNKIQKMLVSRRK